MGNSASGAGKGLTKRECERIQRRFAKLANGEQTMAIAALQSVPELSGNPFVPRLLEMFDEDGDGRVTVAELIRSLEYFTSISSQEERYKFTFRVYNLNADGFVTKREVFETLKMLMGRSIPGAQLEQIAHRTVQMYDQDGDGKLSFQEFKALLHEDDVNKVTSL